MSTNVRIGSDYSADPVLFSDEIDINFNFNVAETSPSPNADPMDNPSVSNNHYQSAHSSTPCPLITSRFFQTTLFHTGQGLSGGVVSTTRTMSC